MPRKKKLKSWLVRVKVTRILEVIVKAEDAMGALGQADVGVVADEFILDETDREVISQPEENR